MDADDMAALIAESVAEMSSSVVEWELRTRYPDDWFPADEDSERREMLTQIYIEERERAMGNERSDG